MIEKYICKKNIMIKIGMIHGRFQPFHMGHFDYFKKALRLVDKQLIIGIINPTSEAIKNELTDKHRHLLSANPYTYFERLQMIQKSISSLDIPIEELNKILILPFPIHEQRLWKFFVPKETVQIMSVLEPWDKEKRERFNEYGYKTYSLDCHRITSGINVRRAIKNKQSWQDLVPVGTREVLVTIQKNDNI